MLSKKLHNTFRTCNESHAHFADIIPAYQQIVQNLRMSEEEKQEGQKTVVAFVAGLLIGGLLVWVFSSSEVAQAPAEVTDDTPSVVTTGDSDPIPSSVDDESEAPTLQIGDGSIEVANQPAGSNVILISAVFPTPEGWIAVRSYPNGQLGSILGAARYSEEQSLVPESVPLLAPTTAGRSYAVVFFSEDGDREFNLANDAQIDGILSTFVAQ